MVSQLFLLVLCGAEGEPLGNALPDGTDLFTLSIFSLLQLGHESSQLLSPVVSMFHEDIQILCVLQQDDKLCHQYQSPQTSKNTYRESSVSFRIFAPSNT